MNIVMPDNNYLKLLFLLNGEHMELIPSISNWIHEVNEIYKAV